MRDISIGAHVVGTYDTGGELRGEVIAIVGRLATVRVASGNTYTRSFSELRKEASTMNTVDVPDLDIDKRLGRVTPNGRLERRIVANLIAHLVARGWTPYELYDGETRAPVTDAKSAMELIFNLDDAWLYFRNAHGRTHWVRLVLGNGCDLISDYSYARPGSGDGFDTAMQTFKPEDYA